MDELFRKAAEDYPLQNGESRWDEVAPKLVGPGDATTPALNNNNYQKRDGIILLILFLFIPGIIMKYTRDYDEMPGRAMPVNNNSKEELHSRELIPGKEKPGYNYPINVIAAGKKPSAIQNAPGVEKLKAKPLNFVNLPGAISIETGKVNAVRINPTVEQKIVTLKPGPVKKHRGIYAGVIFGPTFNEVKNQGLSKPGFDIGIIGGYQFNKRLSLETGLSFSKKYYYSNGKYFDPAKMPDDMEVMSLEGSSSLFEIPLHVKYNLFLNNHSNIYSTAGLSTFLLTSEKNDYQLMVNGSEQNMTGMYKTTSLYLTASAKIGLGYERNIGKHSMIRIEPYLKIPLRGIGVGDMPVMSTGLNIAITRFTQK